MYNKSIVVLRQTEQERHNTYLPLISTVYESESFDSMDRQRIIEQHSCDAKGTNSHISTSKKKQALLSRSDKLRKPV